MLPYKGYVSTLQQEVQVLLNALDFSAYSSFHDPTAGSDTIATTYFCRGWVPGRTEWPEPPLVVCPAADKLQSF
jgi:hypothetical protein